MKYNGWVVPLTRKKSFDQSDQLEAQSPASLAISKMGSDSVLGFWDRMEKADDIKSFCEAQFYILLSCETIDKKAQGDWLKLFETIKKRVDMIKVEQFIASFNSEAKFCKMLKDAIKQKERDLVSLIVFLRTKSNLFKLEEAKKAEDVSSEQRKADTSSAIGWTESSSSEEEKSIWGDDFLPSPFFIFFAILLLSFFLIFFRKNWSTETKIFK